MNFYEESTKVKLWLSIGFMKDLSDRNTGDYKNVFKEDFTFAGNQQRFHAGMMNNEVEAELDKKTKKIFNTINTVEESIAIALEEKKDDSEDDKESELLKDFKTFNI